MARDILPMDRIRRDLVSRPPHSIRTIRTIRTISRRRMLAIHRPISPITHKPTRPDPIHNPIRPDPTNNLPTLLHRRTRSNATPLATSNNCVSSLCLFLTNLE